MLTGKKLKRILALALSLAMVFGMAPIGAVAAPAFETHVQDCSHVCDAECGFLEATPCVHAC